MGEEGFLEAAPDSDCSQGGVRPIRNADEDIGDLMERSRKIRRQLQEREKGLGQAMESEPNASESEAGKGRGTT